MNQAQFERQVNQSAPSHLKESGFLDEAIRLVERERTSLYTSLVPETIMLAGQLYERYTWEAQSANGDSEAGEESSIVFSLARTPTDYLAGDLLVEKLAPWTEDLRKEVFEQE